MPKYSRGGQEGKTQVSVIQHWLEFFSDLQSALGVCLVHSMDLGIGRR